MWDKGIAFLIVLATAKRAPQNRFVPSGLASPHHLSAAPKQTYDSYGVKVARKEAFLALPYYGSIPTTRVQVQ